MGEKRYPNFDADQWVQPVRKGFRFACCDCGLVHQMDFRIHKGRVQFRARRNNRSTALLRRNRPHSHKQRTTDG
jgi:hypothetical protein